MKKNNINYGFMQLLGKFFTGYLPKTINVSNNTIKSYKGTEVVIYPTQMI